MREEKKKECLRKCGTLLAQRDYTCARLREKLLRGGYEEEIADEVKAGETIGTVDTGTEEIPVNTQIAGILRGIIRDGYPVTKGFKLADVDPRLEQKKNCFTISDKARCIAGSVLELVSAYSRARLQG